MLDKERSEELDFLLRTGSHIKIHIESQKDNKFTKDFYTLAELIDGGVFELINMDEDDNANLAVMKDINIASPNTAYEYEHFEIGEVFNFVLSEDFDNSELLEIINNRQ